MLFRSLTDECIAMVEEVVRHATISHLFTPDEQTTIANSVRSDVNAAGLTYSKEVAWNFFVNTVMKNLRVVLVCSQIGEFGRSKFYVLISNPDVGVTTHQRH